MPKTKNSPPAPEPQPEFLPVHAAARLLGMGRTFVESLVRQGQLPAWKFGRRTVLVRREDLVRLATAQPWQPPKEK